MQQGVLVFFGKDVMVGVLVADCSDNQLLTGPVHLGDQIGLPLERDVVLLPEPLTLQRPRDSGRLNGGIKKLPHDNSFHIGIKKACSVNRPLNPTPTFLAYPTLTLTLSLGERGIYPFKYPEGIKGRYSLRNIHSSFRLLNSPHAKKFCGASTKS